MLHWPATVNGPEMLIAHLPSGYILGTFMRRQWPGSPAIVGAAMVGSVIPDIDMLYFHFIDGGRTHHHSYMTHWPLFWAAAGALSLLFVSWRARSYLAATAAFFAAAMLHMVLDTLASPILWLMPFDRRAFELVTVPADFSNWVLSFLLHWTFACELLICGWALWLARGRPQPATNAA